MEFADFFPNNMLPHDHVEFPITPDPRTSPEQERHKRRVESLSFFQEDIESENSVRPFEVVRESHSFLVSSEQRSIILSERQSKHNRQNGTSLMVQENLPAQMVGGSQDSYFDQRKLSSPNLGHWNSTNIMGRSEDFEVEQTIYSTAEDIDSLDFCVLRPVLWVPKPKQMPEFKISETGIHQNFFEAFQSTLVSYKIALDEISIMQAELSKLRKILLKTGICRCGWQNPNANSEKQYNLQTAIGKRCDPIENPGDKGMGPFKKIKNTTVSMVEFGIQTQKPIPTAMPEIRTQTANLSYQTNGAKTQSLNSSQNHHEQKYHIAVPTQARLPWRSSIEQLLDRQIEKPQFNTRNLERNRDHHLRQQQSHEPGNLRNAQTLTQNGPKEAAKPPFRLVQRPAPEPGPKQPTQQQLARLFLSEAGQQPIQHSRPASPSPDGNTHPPRHRQEQLPPSPSNARVVLPQQPTPSLQQRPAAATEQTPETRLQEHTHLPPRSLRDFQSVHTSQTTENCPQKEVLPPTQVLFPPPLMQPSPPRDLAPAELICWTETNTNALVFKQVKRPMHTHTINTPADTIKVKLSPKPLLTVISLCDSEEEEQLTLKELLPPNLQVAEETAVPVNSPARIKVSESDSVGEGVSTEPNAPENPETATNSLVRRDSGIDAIFAKYSGSSIQIVQSVATRPLLANSIVFPDSKLN